MDPADAFDPSAGADLMAEAEEEAEEEEARGGPESSEALATDLQRLTLNPSTSFPSPRPEIPPQAPGLRLLPPVDPAFPKAGIRRVILEQKKKLAHLRSILKNRYSQIQGLLEDPTEALPGPSHQAISPMSPKDNAPQGPAVPCPRRPLTEFSRSVVALFRSFVLQSQLHNAARGGRLDLLAQSQSAREAAAARRRRRTPASWRSSPVKERPFRCTCSYCLANDEDPSGNGEKGQEG
ncbi:uncharacterized protein [Dipodomys merriami]|uniref:uncharacterized protein n=1 Tax=Dipodomys merriami TaxID=94247 RepID=UPI003855A205